VPLVDIAKRNYLQGIMWYSNRIPMGLMDHHVFGKCTLIIYCEEKANAIKILSLHDFKMISLLTI
jgi:hypothetical protein